MNDCSFLHLLLCELVHLIDSEGELLSNLVNILTQDVCFRLNGLFLHLLLCELVHLTDSEGKLLSYLVNIVTQEVVQN